MHRIAVLGAGSWGTALAIHLGHLGHHVTLWARDPSLVEDLRTRRANAVYLPDSMLPAAVLPTASLAEALDAVSLVVVAVPSHGLRSVVRAAAASLRGEAPVVSTTKGLEEGSLLRMSEVVAGECGPHHPVAVLSGPTFASEVARQLPTAVLVASADPDTSRFVQQEFRGPSFRLYASDDVVGVEIGAAMKNIIAIAAGVVESLGLGHNALSALITRGLTEMSRLALALGGRRETLAGLSGLGDLVLTCTGALSRNRRLGIELGRGRPLAEIVAGMKMVAEGVRTTHAALALGARMGVELPITAKMEEVLTTGKPPRVAVGELMDRPQRAEAEL
ncbi:MAG: NAD(P)-dependent glycerol-3-phosphate dehydrogenase [Acidobacteria bacterium]|nr:NAD(P)-dependent glycerol-3-phosphate dehydrogenase [Acidobacteriota bacterium]